MIWTIAKKEFYNHLLTFRLWAGAVLCFLLVPFVLQVSIKRYEEKKNNYLLEVARYDKEAHGAPTYSFVRPTVVRPPQVLSILCSGIEDNVGNEIPIRLGQVPFMPTGKLYGRDNPFLAAFTSIDMTFVLLVVLSLYSLLLTYDSICGEKEQGTLGLIFTNPAHRRKLLLGKYLGVFFILIPLILALFAIAVLMMLSSPSIQLSFSDGARIGIFFLLTCIYSAFFLHLGFLISSSTGNSTTSLMLTVFVWIIIVLILPNGTLHLAREISPAPQKKAIDDAMATLDGEVDKRYDEMRTKRPDDAVSLMNFHFEERPDDGIWVAGNSRESYDYLTGQVAMYDRLLCEYADRKSLIQRSYLDALLRQREITSAYSFLSPAFLYRNASESITGVGVRDILQFLDNARSYRSVFVEFLSQKHREHPYRYITPDDEHQIKPAKEWIAFWTNGRYKSYEDLNRGRTTGEAQQEFLKALDTTGKMAFLDMRNFTALNLFDMPAYRDYSLPTGERMGAILYEVLLLIGMNVVLFLSAHILFTYYDVRYTG